MSKSNRNTGTGLVGVQGPYIRQRHRQRKTGVFLVQECYFQATWQEDGAKRKASFSVYAHGMDGAFALAVKARKQGLKQVGRAR